MNTGQVKVHYSDVFYSDPFSICTMVFRPQITLSNEGHLPTFRIVLKKGYPLDRGRFAKVWTRHFPVRNCQKISIRWWISAQLALIHNCFLKEYSWERFLSIETEDQSVETLSECSTETGSEISNSTICKKCRTSEAVLTLRTKGKTFLQFFHISPYLRSNKTAVTRPLCLVESHTLDAAARRERSLLTSLTCKVWAVALWDRTIICYDQLMLQHIFLCIWW